jgi:hypothetical protein
MRRVPLGRPHPFSILLPLDAGAGFIERTVDFC